MNVVLVNREGGVGKARLAVGLAGEWLLRGSCVALIDADPVASAVDRSDQQARGRRPRLFGVVGLARAAMRRKAPALARAIDDIVIGVPPRPDERMRLALLAADVVLMPVYPPPLDCWASAELFEVHSDVRIRRRQLAARLVLDRRRARRAAAGDTARLLTDHNPPMHGSAVNACAVLTDVVRSDRLVFDVIEQSTAARDIAAFAAKAVRIAP